MSSNLDGEDCKALLEKLKELPGVDLLSSPRVSTANGQQAQIAVMEQRIVPGSAEPVNLGPSIDLVPHVSDDAEAVELSVVATFNMLRPQDGGPDFETP